MGNNNDPKVVGGSTSGSIKVQSGQGGEVELEYEAEYEKIGHDKGDQLSADLDAKGDALSEKLDAKGDAIGEAADGLSDEAKAEASATMDEVEVAVSADAQLDKDS